MQIRVNLKEYPKFWEKLKVAQYRKDINAKSIEQLISAAFGFDVITNGADKLGTVEMDDTTFTWFTMQWS